MSYIGPQVVNFRPSGDPQQFSEAACVSEPEDAMFPFDGDEAGIEYAKGVCRRCPVREACLNEALSRNESSGIWGGTDPGERRAMKRAAAIRRARAK